MNHSLSRQNSNGLLCSLALSLSRAQILWTLLTYVCLYGAGHRQPRGEICWIHECEQRPSSQSELVWGTTVHSQTTRTLLWSVGKKTYTITTQTAISDFVGDHAVYGVSPTIN